MLPEIRLDSESFQEIMEDARGMIASVYPRWTDYNLHDPGITMLELFAFMKEAQQFELDQIGAEHRKRFARLLGVRPAGAAAARMLAKFACSAPVYLAPGSGFLAGGLHFETTRAAWLPGGGIARCVSISGGRDRRTEALEAEQLRLGGRFQFYPFGRTALAGASCTLHLEQPVAGGQPCSLFFRLYDGWEVRRRPLDGPLPFPLARLGLQYRQGDAWKDAQMEQDGTCGLLQTGQLWFRLQRPEDSARELRLVLEQADYDVPPLLTEISVNCVELVQRETLVRAGEERFLGYGNGFPDQRFDLGARGVLPGSVRLLAEDVLRPGRFARWTEVADFDRSGPEDRHFVVDAESGALLFGDGYRGLPPEGELRLTGLAVTEGQGGNIKPGPVQPLQSLPADAVLSGSGGEGGRDAETEAELFGRLETMLRCGGRAVSGDDFCRLVLETPGMMIKACCAMEPEAGAEDAVNLVVRPYALSGTGHLTESCRKNILAWLEPRRLIGTRIALRSPEYIGLAVYVEVRARRGNMQAGRLVEETVARFFREQEDAFGRPVIVGRLYGYIDALEAVEEISMLTLEARGNRVERNAGGDIFPPACGLFLLQQVECRVLNA